jgi:hypothetical protein
MSLAPDRAAAAALLAEANQSERRSAELFHYRMMAPSFILWGVLWAAADLAIAFPPWPWARTWAWAVASLIGSVFMAAYFWRWSTRPGRPKTSRATFWRWFASWFLVIAFITCMNLIFAPLEWRQPHAFWGLFFGFMFASNGVWTGWRLIALGAAMAGLSFYAYLALAGIPFLTFMALVCGGGLVLGGLWLRKV